MILDNDVKCGALKIGVWLVTCRSVIVPPGASQEKTLRAATATLFVAFRPIVGPHRDESGTAPSTLHILRRDMTMARQV